MKILIVEDDTLLLQGLILAAHTDPHRSRYADRQNRWAGCRCR